MTLHRHNALPALPLQGESVHAAVGDSLHCRPRILAVHDSSPCTTHRLSRRTASPRLSLMMVMLVGFDFGFLFATFIYDNEAHRCRFSHVDVRH